MIRRPPRSTQSRSSAASDVYKRQVYESYCNNKIYLPSKVERFCPFQRLNMELLLFSQLQTEYGSEGSEILKQSSKKLSLPCSSYSSYIAPPRQGLYSKSIKLSLYYFSFNEQSVSSSDQNRSPFCYTSEFAQRQQEFLLTPSFYDQCFILCSCSLSEHSVSSEKEYLIKILKFWKLVSQEIVVQFSEPRAAAGLTSQFDTIDSVLSS
eukprot:TRINITY_DN464_c0_g1_i9.p1 TRINITY_DN464_c0_g1~~TRINITY_DN464_c0_g1_i9.p1  ORF type:complete len:208 (+),score=26.61 TRINITY_DN464_c0_g1_i9:20-643(+)